MSYIGNQPISAAFLTDTFSGTGSATAFTMSVAPANTSSILVVVTGVTQDPSTYSVSGTALTFSAAPPSGTNNISVRYLGIPASGVTTTAYRTVTDFTATAGQITFSPASYTVGYINVYRNGVRLASTDYTATTGTTVVLNNACTVGDSVVTESFYVSSVLNAIPATAGSISSTYLASGLTLTSPTLSSPVTSGTPTGVGVLTSGTVVASTSGTSVTFTGIPSWVKRVTVNITGVSMSGTSNLRFRIGPVAGVETSGYLGSSTGFAATTLATVQFTLGFDLNDGGTAAAARNGSFVFSLLDSATNTWAMQGCMGQSNTNNAGFIGGSKPLAGALSVLSMTTTNGTDTFDAGSINILYE